MCSGSQLAVTTLLKYPSIQHSIPLKFVHSPECEFLSCSTLYFSCLIVDTNLDKVAIASITQRQDLHTLQKSQHFPLRDPTT